MERHGKDYDISEKCRGLGCVRCLLAPSIFADCRSELAQAVFLGGM